MKFNYILKNLILEDSRYDILKKTFAEPRKKDDKVIKPPMSVEELNIIVSADPTTRKDGDEIKKAGSYSSWLLKQYMSLFKENEDEPQSEREIQEKKRLFFEDLYKVTGNLTKFDRFKHQIEDSQRDINKQTIDSLSNITAKFSLDKTKTTKEERKEAAKTYEHPGGEVIFRSNQWTVIKIVDTGDLGKDAACFYGGYGLGMGEGETSWCTAAPGGSMFQYYIKQGPLYVIIPNNSKSFYSPEIEIGRKTTLPALRYQFHFPTNQFMNPDDKQINLVEFLNNNEELKEVFKPEFMKSLIVTKTNSVSVDYPKDSASKYIALYGFEEFFQQLPESLERLDFENKTKDRIELSLPSSIGRFKNMNAIHIEGCLKEIPDSISEMKELTFISIPNNPALTKLPESIADLPKLDVLNVKGSTNVKIPESIIENPKIVIFS